MENRVGSKRWGVALGVGIQDRFADFNKSEMERQTSLKTNRPQRETEIAEGRKGDLGDIGMAPDLRNPASIGAY